MPIAKQVISIAVALSFVSATASWYSARLSADQPVPPRTESPDLRAILALNDCLQERFRDVNERFGMSRIIRPGDTAHRFQPENVRELNVVRNLQGANLRVVFYLAGRDVLREMPGPQSWGVEHGWGIIKGPVHITPQAAHRSTKGADVAPPRPRDLWDDSRRAMLAFASRDSHEFENSGWKFIARPVRASEAICLECHGDPAGKFRISNTKGDKLVRLGDAIGAAIYGYREFE